MKETESKKARKEGGSVDLWVGGKKERGGVIIMGGVCYKGCGSHSLFLFIYINLQGRKKMKQCCYYWTKYYLHVKQLFSLATFLANYYLSLYFALAFWFGLEMLS